jgi:tryptophan synthase beta chain
MSTSIPDSERLLADSIAGRFPDSQGRFGPFGGRYVPETLIPALERLEEGIRTHLQAPDFQAQYQEQLRSWVGRPTPLTYARRLSERWGAQIWLKREDLAHTGAHKINNAIGQALLAQRLGAKRIVAETGAGQHGVASAAACARLGVPCTVYMGAVDMERQAPNVGRMRLLGATVMPVTGGDRTLRAAIDEALRDWVADPLDTYYLIGSAVGPHPYPYLVRELQAVIGREARRQMLEEAGGLPDVLLACVGGGSNSIGAFHAFVPERSVAIIGVEAGGRGQGLGDNAATLSYGSPGVLQGSFSMLLQDPIIRVWDLSMRCCSRPGGCATRRPPTKRHWMPCTCAASWKAFCRHWKVLMRSRGHAGGHKVIRASAFSCASRAAVTKTCRPCRRRCWRAADEAARQHQRCHPRGGRARRTGARGVHDCRLPEP